MYVRSLAQRAPALSNRHEWLLLQQELGGDGLSAATVHAFASYLLVSNSINFYAFIVFN